MDVLADLFQVEAGVLSRTLDIIGAADPTVEMALVNHKKLEFDVDGSVDKDQGKVADLAKQSLHELSQVATSINGYTNYSRVPMVNLIHFQV